MVSRMEPLDRINFQKYIFYKILILDKSNDQSDLDVKFKDLANDLILRKRSKVQKRINQDLKLNLNSESDGSANSEKIIFNKPNSEIHQKNIQDIIQTSRGFGETIINKNVFHLTILMIVFISLLWLLFHWIIKS